MVVVQVPMISIFVLLSEFGRPRLCEHWGDGGVVFCLLGDRPSVGFAETWHEGAGMPIRHLQLCTSWGCATVVSADGLGIVCLCTRQMALAFMRKVLGPHYVELGGGLPARLLEVTKVA